jgi:cell division protein FtsL
MYFLRYLYILCVVVLLTLFLTSNTDLYVLRFDVPFVDVHLASQPLPTFAILVAAFAAAFLLVWFGHTLEQLRREAEVRRLRRENAALNKEVVALNQRLEQAAAAREAEVERGIGVAEPSANAEQETAAAS